MSRYILANRTEATRARERRIGISTCSRGTVVVEEGVDGKLVEALLSRGNGSTGAPGPKRIIPASVTTERPVVVERKRRVAAKGPR